MVLRLRFLRPRRHDPSVTPAVIDQRIDIAAIEIDYLAQENRVIPALVFEAGTAAEACRISCDQRRAFRAIGHGQAGELVPPAARKPVGHVLLIAGQHVDGPGGRVAKGGEAGAAQRKAPQNHRRIERDGIEAVRRQAHRIAVAIARGDDRYPRHKTAEGIAEGGLVDHPACTRGDPGHWQWLRKPRPYWRERQT